jgi:hypothetical protein
MGCTNTTAGEEVSLGLWTPEAFIHVTMHVPSWDKKPLQKCIGRSSGSRASDGIGPRLCRWSDLSELWLLKNKLA